MLANPMSSHFSPPAHPRFADNAGAAPGDAAAPIFRTPIATTGATPIAASDAEGEHSGQIAKAARHLVRQALHDFRNEIKNTLDDLGFGREEIADIVNGVMDPVRDALKSGQSFSAQIIVAAATQVSYQGNGVQAQQFNLAVDALEIQYNHDTGEVSVARLSVDVEAKSVATGGAPAPQLFDIRDGAGALPDLGGLLAAVGDIFDRILAANQANDAGPAPITAPGTAAAPAEEPATGEAAVAEDPAAPAPAEKARAYARISVDLFEQFINARGQTISRLRLSAQIPLNVRAADVPVPALPVDPAAPAAAPGPISIQA